MHVLVQSLIDGLLFGAIYAIASAAFGLLYDVSKVFHIAFGSIGTLGTFVAVGIAGQNGGLGSVLGAVAIGVLVGAATTMLVVRLVYQPLVRRGADAGITFVSSLGLSLLVQAVVVLIYGPGNRAFAVDGFIRRHDVAGFGVSTFHVVSIVLAALLVAGLALLLRRTRFGHQVRALSSNHEQAQLVGIRTGLVATGVCGLAGGLSVIAFVLLGMNGAVITTGGTQLTLFALLAVIAAGSSNLGGTVAVGVGIGVLGAISATVVPGQWSTSVVFVCTLALVLARPGGVGLRRAANA